MKKYILPLVILTAFSIQAFAQNFHLNEDFNSGSLPSGWTNSATTGTNAWSFGIDGSLGSHAGNQNLDGTSFVFFDDDVLGASSLGDSAELVSPSFDNSTEPITYLEFDYNFREFAGIPDSLIVEVYDGTNWVTVFTRSTDDCGNYIAASCQGSYPHAKVDISSHANANCQIRFTYTDGGDWAWYVGIDNVQVQSPYPNDLGVVSIEGPVSSCGLSTDSVIVLLTNFGTQNTSTFDVSYTVNGGTPVTETVNVNMAYQDTLRYAFNTLANFSTIGTYNIVSYTTLTSDSEPTNDTTQVSIDNNPIYTPIYTEDFESTNGGWTVEGRLPSWEWGVPQTANMNTAPSGQKAWVTDLNGTYNPSERSYLVSPCFDFSASVGDPIMTFSLNRRIEPVYDSAWMEYTINNGQTWTKLLGSPNATNWYNNTANQVWDGNSAGWVGVENALIGLGGEPQVKFRFVIKDDGNTQLQGLGIDLFSIRDPQPIDMSLNRLLYPSPTGAPVCGYGQNENIIIELENKGANTVSSFDVSYQVDNGAIFTETVNVSMQPYTRYTYTFTNKYNFSALRNYNIDLWVTATGDGFAPNDSVLNRVVRNTQNSNPGTIPYIEDFDGFTTAAQNGWSLDNNGTYSWQINSGGTGSFATGPDGDHTTGNDNYVYTEASFGGSGNISNYESPCFDFSNNAGVRLTFWWHRYGSNMGPLHVDVNDGGNWVNVATITAQPQNAESDDWVQSEINLNAYAGRRTKFRFRAQSLGCCAGDMAIDDIVMFEPREWDANMLGPIAPFAGCEVNDQSVVTVEVKNEGSRDILPDSMMVYYQVGNQAPVGEPYDQVLASEQTGTYTFNQTADLSIPNTRYNIKSWASLPRDENILNDTVPYYRVYNDTKVTNYFEDFETARDASQSGYFGQVLMNGWTANYTPYAWNVQSSLWGKGENLTPQAGTGPSGDHTTGNGMFLYTSTTNMPQGANVAYLSSPCVDLTQNTEAKMSFWYHKYGNQMGSLQVEVLDNNGVWQNELTINGATQNASEDPWKLATVNLNNYVGQYTQVRLVGTNGGARGHMAIDDVFIFDPVSYDVGVVDIPSPSGNSCNLSSTATVSAKIQNLGNMNLPANSIEIRYTVNRNQLAIDTITSALLAGNTLTHTFSQTADLTAGGDQDIRVSVDLIGLTDSIRLNNSSEKTVINRKIGFPYYFQDFETFGMGSNYAGDDLQGWSRNPNGFGHTWHVWQGPAPTIDGEPLPPPPIEANGPSGDHTFATPSQNGNGMYMLVETKFRNGGIPDAELTTPCNGIDFSQSKNGKILLTFWYHMFGNVGDLFIDVHNGTQWINGVSVIRGQQHLKATDPWKQWRVSLDNFSNVSNAQIRFRADYLGNLGGGDIGLDDVAILDRDTIDAMVEEFKRPESDCNKANNEEVRVIVRNTGTQDIYRLDMGYQVTYTPLNGPKVVYPVVQEFDVVTIIPLAQYTYNFTDRVDMTSPGKYEFKVWTEVQGDFYAFNDTLERTIYNETLPFPYCVDFSELLYGDIAKDFLDEKLRNNWVGNQSAYSFKASMGGPTDAIGGPIDGNTSGINDIYLLLDDADGMPPQTGWIRTPCFDLTATRAANLEFYYQATNPNHYLEIQISNDAANWQDLDTLYGPPGVSGWTPVSIVLADYVGQIVYFRFRGSNVGGGYYAIDDVCVIQPPPQQIELERIVLPPKDFCYYSSAEDVRLRVQNVGVDRIDSFQVRIHVDKDFTKFPIGQHFSDTFMVYPTNPTLEPGDKLDFTLPSSIDMSEQTFYYISAYVSLPGDLDTTNNFIKNEEWEHPVPIQIPYVIDFEDPVDPLNGLLFGANGDYSARIWQGMDQFGTTGPSDDHTFQNGTGNYFVTNAAAGRGGDYVVLQSECIDLSQTVQPELQYWYHRFGSDMGNFYVQINDDYGWVNVDSLVGQHQTNNTRPWALRQVDLGAYAGDFIRFRMISLYGGGDFGNMGLDDIFIFDLASKDASPAGLDYPNEHIYSCYTDTQSVWVNLRNNGADSLDFEDTDTVHFEVLIKKDGVAWDTLYKTLHTNKWGDPDDAGRIKPLPRDTVVKVMMDGTFDMSEIGAMFDFEVRVNMITDVLRRNDTAEYSVLARRETGFIPIDSILPNDTVCYGSPVQLKVKDFFGKLTWQVRELDKNGNGFWFDGFTFPNNDSSYVQVFDTTTEVRVQVCRVEETDTVKVDISKPYSGKALNASRCGIGPISVAVQFPYKGPDNYENIDSVFIFESGAADANDTYLEAGEPYLSNGKLRYDLNFDSLYVDSNIVSIADSALLDTAIVFEHSLWVRTKSDSCWSPVMTKVTATINNNPRIPVDTIAGDTIKVCQDTAYVLNAGAYDGRQFNYTWTIVNPDGTVTTSNSQVQLIDAWKLEKNSLFKYTIEVQSDSGCFSTLNGPNDTIYVQIVDSCVTSIEEYKFGDEFTIYPNPTNNQVYVEYRSLNDLVGTVKLMSMDGKLIEQHTNVNFRQQTTRFDLGQYAKGIYFIKIETPDGVVVRKIVRS